MMPSPTLARLVPAAALAILAACATAPEPQQPTAPPAGPREPAPRLPPILAVDGPLELRVSYPAESGYVATRGRNFIFGSAGNGRARVWIDGEEIDVRPNGGFLAFLPVPEDGVYRLRAELDGDTASLEVPISLPAPPPPPADTTVIVAGSVSPGGAWAVRPGERIPVSFRGTPGGEAWLVFGDGERVPLVERGGQRDGGATDFEVSAGAGEATAPRYSTYAGFFTARRVLTADTTVAWPTLTGEPRPEPPARARLRARERQAGAPVGEPAEPVPADTGTLTHRRIEADNRIRLDPVRLALAGAPDSAGAAVVLAVNGDTTARPLPLNLVPVDPDRPRVGIGHDADPPERNGDGHINARPGPGGGPYHYVWRNDVELELTGERNGIYRVRLTDDLDAWTPAGDIRLARPGTPPPVSRVSTVRMDPQPGYIDVRVALTRRLPYAIEEGDRSLSLLVYGATSRANFLQHGRTDPYIVRGEWRQPSDRLFRLDLHLAGMPWGYETFWGEGGDLVLRVKRPPALDPEAPLRGLRVGIDPGHGGAEQSAMGPTGFTEANANLGISLALADMLRERGAEVVLTRATDTTLSLVQRTDLARERDVDLWVSVHNNAFPDGVNPWENNGTSVYYNHPRAAGLAWSVHTELLEELGLRDLGVGRADFHQPRFTWAPSILTETSFMMIPEQEAFLRTAEGQRRIARAHVRGLEAWVRSVAR